jgi:hypothetical protein
MMWRFLERILLFFLLGWFPAWGAQAAPNESPHNNNSETT